MSWDEAPRAPAQTFTFPASDAVPEAAVAVELACQTASGASFFARLGGHLRPGPGHDLVVTVCLPVGCERPAELAAALAAGIASLPERPAGRLELSWFAVHPVDFRLWAWERSAATICRLMFPDVTAMPAAQATLVASEWAAALPRSARLELVVADDVESLLEMAAARIRACASDAILMRRRFRVALAGGSTPRALYPRLVGGVDWAHADVFFGDERVVPPDDPQSNYRMARETLLAPARVPAENVFRWHTEAADLDAAARDYEQALRAGAGPPWLDLALLGLGPDGHTASLFPGTAALAEGRRLAVAVDVPALGARRLTLTYAALLRAEEVFFLVTGAEKRAALADVLRPGSTLPAARIVHRPGPVVIFCDREASQDITSPR